jgi:hypothetical protein
MSIKGGIMLVIDPEALVVLSERDCREEKIVCGLLNVFMLSEKKADGSGYYLCVGVVVNGRFELLTVSRSGNVYGSIRRKLEEFCNGRNVSADELRYKGVVIGDDKFILMFSDDMKGIGEKLLREKLEVIRRVWVNN